MKTSRPVYCLICESDGGSGGPIIMESYLNETRESLEYRARRHGKTWGKTWIVELPVQITTSVVRLAGSQEKVTIIGESENV